jgi:hypothetical protein
VDVFVRWSSEGGRDVDGACGQLALKVRDEGLMESVDSTKAKGRRTRRTKAVPMVSAISSAEKEDSAEPEWWSTVPPNLSSVQRSCGGGDNDAADIEDLAPRKTGIAAQDKLEVCLAVVASETELAAGNTDKHVINSSSSSCRLWLFLIRMIRSRAFSLMMLLSLVLLIRRRSR